MISIYKSIEVSFDNEFIFLSVNGKKCKVRMGKVSLKMKNAEPIQRQFFKISPSRYGIHWPLLDEELALHALLKIEG